MGGVRKLDMPAQQCASEMANLRRAQSGPLNAVMVQGRETVNTEASEDISKKAICIGVTTLVSCVIALILIALFLVVGVIIIAHYPYCDALYFGTKEIHTVSLPDLRNLSQSELNSLLIGRYELSSEYNLGLEIDGVGIISLCILKRYVSKESACLQIGTESNVEQIVICSPEIRADCLPSAIVEHYFGLSLWSQEESTVAYFVINIDTGARAGKNLTNTTTTLPAVWYELLGVCTVVVNVTIAVIFFGVLIFVCGFGCATFCLRGCYLHCKEKRELRHQNINELSAAYQDGSGSEEETRPAQLISAGRVSSTPLDPLHQKPILRDLNNKVVVRVAGKWETTGLELDIEDYVLQAIKTPNGSNEFHCREMFRRWLAREQGCGTLPRTWSSVLDAVERSYGTEVSQELRELIH